MAKSRTSKSTLFRMIQESSIPIYAVSTGMRIVFCNEALCTLTGHEDEFLTGLTCVYQTAVDQPPSRKLATGLCPPPDCFFGDPVEAWITIPKGNTVQYRQAMFVPNQPIDWPSDSPHAGVIVFVFGQSCAQPELDLSPDETPEPQKIHTAIAQMQFQTTSSTSIDRLVGSSPLSMRVRRQVQLAGQSGANTTIIGSRGSGRAGVVPLIHFADGPEMAGPLIPIHCPFSDRESVQDTIKELYRSQKQYPNDPLGRVFLKDVDQLSKAAQNEILGFLKLPDFRLPLIATSRSNQPTSIHPELWQYLSTVVIELAPLADRRQDIPYLAQAIVEQFNDVNHAQLSGIDDETMALLVGYSWPAELNELMEAIDFACRAANPPRIKLSDLPQHLRIAMRADQLGSAPQKTVIDLDQFLGEIEEELIRRAVAHTDGNKSEAARLLSISRPRLLRRLDADRDSNVDEKAKGQEAEERSDNAVDSSDRSDEEREGDPP